VIEHWNEHTVYLHFYEDYGSYRGSIKYVFDLSSRKPPVKIPYGILALTSSTRMNGELHNLAEFIRAGEPEPGWEPRYATISIHPAGGDSLPTFKIIERPAPDNSVPEQAPLHLSTGETVTVANTTPPGQPQQPSGIYVASKSGRKQFYIVPFPTMAQYHQLLPDKQAPAKSKTRSVPMLWRVQGFGSRIRSTTARALLESAPLARSILRRADTRCATCLKSRLGPDRPCCWMAMISGWG